MAHSENSDRPAKGFLKVSDIHTLYYEVYGKESGIPVLFLHGGPGAGFSDADQRFFDPDIFRVIFFDQRGSSRSTPFGATLENTTEYLVEDINRLLDFFGIDSFYIFGGSWGSTLALVYAIQHTERVRGLILRGIFLANQSSIDHFVGGGVKKFHPEAWQRFVAQVPAIHRQDIAGYYLDRMKNGGNLVRRTLAYEWAWYEISIFEREISDEAIAAVLDTLPFESLAILEAHYIGNRCFLEENYILERAGCLENIPIFMVQGRYDMICPPLYAYQLHRQLPHSELFLVDAGHSDREPAIEKALLDIMAGIGAS